MNSGKMTDHLKGIERMAEQRMDTLLPQLLKAVGVTEELKARDQMAWVGLVLTFEKVMELFKGYLAEDTRYEIVMTSRGYTVLGWDSSANTWAGEELCATPEIMRDVLLDCFSGYLEYKAITANGEITKAEQERITARRQVLLEKPQ